MRHFTIEASPNLSVHERAFGARIVQRRVLLPQPLTSALSLYAIGDDAVTVAGFLKSFPTVAVGLGLSCDKAHNSAVELVDLLKESGADVSTLKKTFVEPPYGALNPYRPKKF